jgi:mono/diheme cytochrome c family protein
MAVSGPAFAESPAEIQRALEAEARRATPEFAGFSARRGEQLFHARQRGEWSCVTCHTADPRQPGRHATTGKSIAPLAPAANPDRFTTPAKVEKWFRRNCNDVLGRACTSIEKGDVLAWLLSLGR